MDKVMLIILDGLGLGPKDQQNAAYLAQTPCLDSLEETWPHSRLQAAGSAVGLPEGQIGNSEVGHLNIGAGRIVYQDLTRINQEIQDGSFFTNPALNQAIDQAQAKGTQLHYMGLVSKGGVHSSLDQLYALVDLAAQRDFKDLNIHCFLDGRDVLPKSAYKDIQEVQAYLQAKGTGRISTLVGRYYAMDRDSRWDRTQRAYEALVHGQGSQAKDPFQAIDQAYQAGQTDEFIEPIILDGARIGQGDSVVFFNFRADRARQLTRPFIDPAFSHFPVEDLGVHFTSLTEYDVSFENIHLAYGPQEISNNLGQYLSSQGARQLRIAETEKYAHVTFFFNGGVEKPYPGEDRVLIESPKVATYDLKPEMSAPQLTERLIQEIDKETYDFITVNYANPDMVGHTGKLDPAIQAVEVVDQCLAQVLPLALDKDYQVLITADHGNVEQMKERGKDAPYTAHTTNPVPLILAGADYELEDGKLSNLAPTILDLMGLDKAEEMTEDSLLRR